VNKFSIEKTGGSQVADAPLPAGEPEVVPDNQVWQVVDHIWRHRDTLVEFGKRGLCLAILVAFLLPNRFTSTARVLPPDSQVPGLAMLAALGGGSNGMGMGAVANDLLGIKTSGAVYSGMLKSNTVQNRVIDRLDLRRVYWVSRWEDARKILGQRSEILEDRKSGLLTISVMDSSPARAQAIAEAYVTELDAIVSQVSTSAAKRERMFIEDRLKVVKQDLDRSIRALSEFSSTNATLDIREQGKSMVEAAALLQGQLIVAESEVAGLRQTYTSNNVRVRAAEARVNELRSKLKLLAGEKGSSGSEAALSAQELYPSIRQLPVLGVKYAELYRNVKVQEAIFEALTKQYELAKVQEAKEIPTVKVLDHAVMPERRSSPQRPVIILAGTLFALALGVTWLVLTYVWQTTSSQDPKRVLIADVGRWASQTLRGILRPHRYLELRDRA
jgi:capsule polysaccharide export protein KpsE/RkpR